MHNTAVNYALAQHYLEIRQPQRSLDLLQPSASGLESGEFWLLRSQALYNLGRYPEAAQAAHEGLRYGSTSVPLLALLAGAEAEQGKLAAAAAALLTALGIEPENATLLAGYALLMARGGQFAQAGHLLDRAAALDPDEQSMYHVRALLAYLQDDSIRMSNESYSCLARDPEDHYAHYLLGQSFLAQRRFRAASRALSIAARIDPFETVIVEAARKARALCKW